MSALEICDVRREIHGELGRELVRQLTCIDINWALLLRQILLEEEEVRAALSRNEEMIEW